MSELRRWWFTVEDIDGNSYYVDGNGKNTNEPVEWIGDDLAAQTECNRRVDLWESDVEGLNYRLAAAATRESRGRA